MITPNPGQAVLPVGTPFEIPFVLRDDRTAPSLVSAALVPEQSGSLVAGEELGPVDVDLGANDSTSPTTALGHVTVDGRTRRGGDAARHRHRRRRQPDGAALHVPLRHRFPGRAARQPPAQRPGRRDAAVGDLDLAAGRGARRRTRFDRGALQRGGAGHLRPVRRALVELRRRLDPARLRAVARPPGAARRPRCPARRRRVHAHARLRGPRPRGQRPRGHRGLELPHLGRGGRRAAGREDAGRDGDEGKHRLYARSRHRAERRGHLHPPRRRSRAPRAARDLPRAPGFPALARDRSEVVVQEDPGRADARGPHAADRGRRPARQRQRRPVDPRDRRHRPRGARAGRVAALDSRLQRGRRAGARHGAALLRDGERRRRRNDQPGEPPGVHPRLQHEQQRLREQPAHGRRRRRRRRRLRRPGRRAPDSRAPHALRPRIDVPGAAVPALHRLRRRRRRLDLRRDSRPREESESAAGNRGRSAALSDDPLRWLLRRRRLAARRRPRVRRRPASLPRTPRPRSAHHRCGRQHAAHSRRRWSCGATRSR